MTKTLKFKSTNRDRLFYDKYRYCVTFKLAEANALVNLNHDYIDSVLVRRQEWRDSYHERWSKVVSRGKQSQQVYRVFGQVLSKWEPITDKTFRDLHNVADFLLEQTDEYKLVTTDKIGRIYTNSTPLLKKIRKRQELSDQEYSEAHITRTRDTIALKNPHHTHRSYFKSVKLSEGQKINLVKFFDTYRDTIRPSPAFTDWLPKPFVRLQDYYFMDHDGDSWLLLLALVIPGTIRKTVELVPA